MTNVLIYNILTYTSDAKIFMYCVYNLNPYKLINRKRNPTPQRKLYFSAFEKGSFTYGSDNLMISHKIFKPAMDCLLPKKN